MEKIITDISHEFIIPLHNPILVFGLLLAIILLSSVMLKRINLPNIVGFIIAGVIIGPHGLHVIDNDTGIKMFSTIGLLYIMFIAGLELDFNEFRANKNKSITFGIYTFIIPMLIGYPVCHYLLGYDVLPSLLTASMFSTHTLVSYPIVSRMGVSKNQAVAITVGGTILTDAAVLIMLAAIVSGNEGDLSTAFWITLLISLAIFSFIVFKIIPIISKWFFQKIEDDKYSHYIYVLLVLFTCGFLAEMSGMEPIIGAFAAGLALNKFIPHTSALMNRIDFFGNALFIPIFLISVGMLVDVNVVFNGWRTLTVAVVLTIVALIGKWTAAFAAQKTYKYSLAQRNVIFGLSSSHAAATLAIIIVGFNVEILDEHILNGTILLILVTCIISTLTTQKAARQIAIQSEGAPFTPSQLGSFAQEKILLPVANVSNIGRLVNFAMLIKDPKSENSISLLGVVPNNEASEKHIVDLRKKLEKSVDMGVSAGVNVDIITTIDHNVPNGIVRTARETMADIVIIGWPCKVGFVEKLLGEKVDTVIRNLDKNLFICHIEKPLLSNKRIVVMSAPYSEKEYGFKSWVKKVARLSQELSIPILHIGDPETQKIIKHDKANGKSFSFMAFSNWTDPMSCCNIFKEDDLVILILAHNGYLSYRTEMDHFPSQLENKFPHINRIAVYPRQHIPSVLLESEHSAFASTP